MSNELIKKFDKDSVIFREGDDGNIMYIIHRGRVRIVKQIQNSFETLGVLERGDFFGELAIIESQPRSATAIALDDGTDLIEIDQVQFEKMLKDNIEVAIRMIRKYARRLIDSNERLESIIRDKQELNSGIQDILSNVRHKREASAEDMDIFGWLESSKDEKQFELRRPEVLIGRQDKVTNMKPHVDLTNFDDTRTVSRRHARISWLDDNAFISEEVGVVNGTFLNDSQIERGKLVKVQNGDIVRFGELEFKIKLDPKNKKNLKVWKSYCLLLARNMTSISVVELNRSAGSLAMHFIMICSK